MVSKQQEETQIYFNKHARQWQKDARREGPEEVNGTKLRNDYVLSVIDARRATRSALDVGCGSGELVCEMARRRVRATGIDFADEMICAAREAASREKLSSARFLQGSVFQAQLDQSSYDAISANGFIEYISVDELKQFLRIAHHALAPDGSLVLSSRNRLFNLFSVNTFTAREIAGGACTALLNEAVHISRCREWSELEALRTAPLPSQAGVQENTGIDVSIRYQYTPVQLMQFLKEHGFRTEDVFPIHIHGTSPQFKKKYPETHARISNALHAHAAEDRSLIPFASSFMIHGCKI